jgi:amino acid adenylation domain-containing protein
VRFLKNPTITQLITEATQELLTQTTLVPEKGAQGRDSIEPQNGIAIPGKALELPLSFGQRGIWFLYQLSPTSPAYNVIFAARIRSSLHVPSLEKALQRLTDRHPSLRTTFTPTANEVKQLIHPTVTMKLLTLDATHWSQNEIDERLVQEAHRPFDLLQGPVFRASLFTCAETEHVLLLNAHHIIIDFWSLTVLIKELGEQYQAERNGCPVHFPTLTLSYQDFVRGQSAALESPRSNHLREYWQRQLAQPYPTLDLPLTGSRPPVQTYKGASQTLKVNPDLTTALKQLSEQAGVTLYTTLLTAFMVLLHRLSNQDDIIVGTPTAGRNQAEFMNVVGYFVNMLPMRANLAGKPGFTTLLQRIRLMVLEAFEHQDYPFSLMVEHLQGQHDISRFPLFQIVFVLQKAYYLHEEGLTSFALNESEAHLHLNGLDLESIALKQRVAQFDITCSMVEAHGGLLGSFEYNVDLFSSETMQRMAQYYLMLLEQIVRDPEQSIATLSLLTPEEQRQILIEWNTTAYPYSQEYCVHQLFELQATINPSGPAVMCEEATVSYQELNRKSNQLAHYLRSLGIGPEMRVGICITPSFEMLIGLLAILKAGGVYIPLDPDYPQDRKAFMLNDAQVLAVLTLEHLKPGLPEQRNWPLLSLDNDWETYIADQPATNLTPIILPENLAYIIYTSGSTGRPKGVEISHGSLLNLVSWHQRVYEITPVDRATHLAGFGFDATVWEIWPYLCAGACLFFPDKQTRLSPPLLKDWLLAKEITISFLPTPLAERVLEETWPAQTPLRALLTGGDRLRVYPAPNLPFALINHYGPTEATVVTSAGLISPTTEPTQLPTIGRPIANVQVYVLDAELQPVPNGHIGELFIGGLSLARGYLNRPDFTATQFIPHPFAQQPGQRLYKTGDLVRYRPDSTLEFIGRYDHQIKIRGFRIETGEIEAVLSQHHQVRENIVVVDDEHNREKRLQAYIIPRSKEVTIEELRLYLKERIPYYMLPTTILFLKEFPLTPNGKIDRTALPLVALADPAKEHKGSTPTSEIERQLVVIWQETLGIQTVGIHDSFFDLGGHSLLLLKVCERIRTLLHQPLDIIDMFQYTTIQALAEYLETGQQEQTHLQKRLERAQLQRQSISKNKTQLQRGRKNA